MGINKDKSLKEEGNEAYYEVSFELIEILLRNGYNDNTEIAYPEFWVQMKNRGYVPGTMKRHFKFANNNYIVFDYTKIVISNFNYTFWAPKISKETLFNILAMNYIPKRFAEYFKTPHTVGKRYVELLRREKAGIELTNTEKQLKIAAKNALEKINI